MRSAYDKRRDELRNWVTMSSLDDAYFKGNKKFDISKQKNRRK